MRDHLHGIDTATTEPGAARNPPARHGGRTAAGPGLACPAGDARAPAAFLRRARRSAADFLAGDEHGGATLWNLFWLCGFGVLLGVGVDTTAAMNSKAQLQSVADAASHAAVMDLFPVSQDAVATAVAYAHENLPQAEDGAVVESDVTLGYWDRSAGSFQTGDVPYLNAVRVVATRDGARKNALATSFLHMAGFKNWDIAAASVSMYFGDLSLVDRCRKNGLFAGGELELTSNNLITGQYCVHGEGGLKIAQNNVVTCGVEMSLPDPSDWMSQSVPTPTGEGGECDENYGGLSNEQMVQQSVRYRSITSHAELEYDNVRKMVEAFIDGTLDNDPFNAIPPYITHAQSISASDFNSLSQSGTLTAGTLYAVTCGMGEVLQPKGMLRNVGIYTDCIIKVRKDPTVSKKKPQKIQNTDGDEESTGGLIGGLLDGITDGITDDSTGELCDPDVETCSDVEWMAEIVPPDLNCETALAAGYEAYGTYLDTAVGRTYRDGQTVDTIAQECAIEPGANGLWDNVFVFSTAYEDGDRSQAAITLPNNMQIGRIDACTEGGGARIYAAGSLSTPSGTIVHGSHITLLGDAHLAAKVDGTYGLVMEAAGDITLSAQGQLGGCSAAEADLASDVVFTVRPIAIVN